LTDLGRGRASQYLEVNQYIGAAPVSLDQYVGYMRALSAARGHVGRPQLASAFEHLIVNPAMFDKLGPAINSGKSLFLYGAPGNGKTVVAEGCGRVLGGEMYVPCALEIGGQIIAMFDPVTHRSKVTDTEQDGLITRAGHDRRWERIQRPVVVVGGELTLDMLDLSFNTVSKFYEAPIQLKANGGVFVVDDFGRQRMSPRDLLNRWIVPLESRRDYLTLHTGRKFQVPFDVLMIFATNLDPSSLADEAFLRRIPYKIAAHDPTPDEYSRIFELNCRRYHVAFDHRIVEYLLVDFYRGRGLPLRACHPRDLIEQVVNRCRYQGCEPVLTREAIDAACQAYFVQQDEASMGSYRAEVTA
jgi:SpoVK/Ycf46/Vps4 family AAA+-type ATPase